MVLNQLLKIENLLFKYDGSANESDSKLLFDHFNLQIKPGEFISILGANGSGKSTLAKIMVGLLAEDDESVVRNGRIGMVFQNPERQFVGATVADDVAFGLENLQIKTDKMHEIVNRALKQVSMQEYMEQPVENLSGGQQQRVAIASTIVLNPDMIIFDEATSMLDPLAREQIISLILELKKQNPKMAIVMITHNMDEAAKSQRTIILNDGKIVADSSTDKILSDHKLLRQNHLRPTTAGLLADALAKNKIKVPKKIIMENSVEKIGQWLSNS